MTRDEKLKKIFESVNFDIKSKGGDRYEDLVASALVLNRDPESQTIANFRLIAIAPELYELAKAVGESRYRAFRNKILVEKSVVLAAKKLVAAAKNGVEV